MDQLDSIATKWLAEVLGVPYTVVKHTYSHQDDVYKIETLKDNYYLKISSSLKAERDNLRKLGTLLSVPKVIDFYQSGQKDYLLITELPGRNLAELKEAKPKLYLINTFAKAVRKLHSLDAMKVFPAAGASDVLLHGDMAMPNIIISEHGQIGYVDFGQLAFGSPELDLVDAIWSLQRNIGPGYGELFLKQYGSVHMTPKIERTLKFRYQPAEGE